MLVFISNDKPVSVPYVDEKGNQYPPNMEELWTADELAAIGLKAVTVNTPPSLNFLQFLALFTSAEQVAIASSNDPQIRLFNLQAAGAPQIDLADPRVIGGVHYLASLSLIAPERVALILAGTAPA